MNQKRILIVDENINVYKNYCRILNEQSGEDSSSHSAHYLIDYATCEKEALELISQAQRIYNHYALVFVNMGFLPELPGIEMVKHIWKIDPDLQIIMCTEYTDYSWQDILYRLRYADNFLILRKDFEETELKQIVSTLTKKWELIANLQKLMKKPEKEAPFTETTQTQTQHQHEQIFQDATHDNITHLLNDTLLRDRMQQLIQQAQAHGLYLAVLLFDITNLQEINHLFGMQEGDGLLKLVAEKIKKNIRETDTVTRYGGGKFIIVMPTRAKKENIIIPAQRLLSIASQAFQIQDQEIYISVNIGISVYPKDSDDPQLLLKSAETALQYAKELGRNTFQFYDPEFKAYVLRRREILASLPGALSQKEFQLCYKPLIALDSQEIIGVEALLHWKHPSLGDLSPGVFVSLAAEAGLIPAIGTWILKTASAQAQNWLISAEKFHIAVPVFVQQLQQPDFIDNLKDIIQAEGISANIFEFEITENVQVGHLPEFSKKMEMLKNLGIRFIMADLEADYANLSYLKDFPFDKVKMDKDLLYSTSQKNTYGSLVEAVISVAKNLNMEVIAEDVETPKDIAFLKQSHHVTAYYLGPAMSEKKFTQLLKNKNKHI